MTEEKAIEITHPAITIGGMPPVALLIDGDTLSSGEALAVAFRGRPNTRFFGQRTYGLASANRDFPLIDGARLQLTVALDADRNGKIYANGIFPDEEIEFQPMRNSHNEDNVRKALLKAASD
jgi:carboxyl-terminal processing protease